MINSLKWMWKAPISGLQLYMVAFIVYFVPTIILETMYIGVLDEHLVRLVSYLAIPILLLKFYLVDNWSLKVKLLSVPLLLIIGIIWRSTQNADILMTGMFLLSIKNVDFKMIVRMYFYLIVTTISIVMMTALLKIIPNLVFRDPTMTRVDRYSVGMNYPTLIASHAMFGSLSYFYLRFGKIRWFDYGGVGILALVIMKFTDTRLDFYATLLMIPLVLMAQFAYRNDGIIRKIISFEWMATPILTALILIMTYFYQPNNHILEKLNQLISGRLRLGKLAFQKLNPNLFGQYITEHSYGGLKGLKLANGQQNVNYFYVDSSYVRMFLMWGLIIFIAYIVIMTGIALIDTVNHQYILSTIVLVIAINSVIEPHAIQLIYNIFILAIGSSLATLKKLNGDNNEN